MRRNTTDGRGRAATPVRGSRQGSRRGIVLGLLAAIAAIALPVGGSAGVAVASAGSVPAEVSAFVSGGLLAQLDEYFGPAADGSGIAFDETTEFGAVHRVFSWSPDFLAGVKTEHPVEMLNEWITVVSLQGAAIGLATISIEPSSVKPELVDFRRSAVLATALRDVPDAATLVRQDAASAWFALTDGELVPLVAGSSGIAAATPVADYQRAMVTPPQPPAEPQFGPGFVLPAVAIGAIVVLLVVFLLLPGRRRVVEDGEEADETVDSELASDSEQPSDSEQTTAAEEDADTSEPGTAPAAKPGVKAKPRTKPVSGGEVEQTSAAVPTSQVEPKPKPKATAAKKPAAAPPTEASDRKPAQKSATKPAATPAAASLDKPAEQPAERPARKPAQPAKKTSAQAAATPGDAAPTAAKAAQKKVPPATTAPAKTAPAKRPTAPRS